MITNEMKEKMFAIWINKINSRPHYSKCAECEGMGNKFVFNAALDLILPLLEKSLDVLSLIGGEQEFHCGIGDASKQATARQAIQEIESELKKLGGGDE